MLPIQVNLFHVLFVFPYLACIAYHIVYGIPLSAMMVKSFVVIIALGFLYHGSKAIMYVLKKYGMRSAGGPPVRASDMY